MRVVQFTMLAHSQLQSWKKNDQKIFARIEKLIESINENPYHGIGKPEPLKHELSGHWSRRINVEHRLIYRVTNETIIVVACKYHY